MQIHLISSSSTVHLRGDLFTKANLFLPSQQLHAIRLESPAFSADLLDTVTHNHPLSYLYPQHKARAKAGDVHSFIPPFSCPSRQLRSFILTYQGIHLLLFRSPIISSVCSPGSTHSQAQASTLNPSSCTLTPLGGAHPSLCEYIGPVANLPASFLDPT